MQEIFKEGDDRGSDKFEARLALIQGLKS